MAEIDGPTFLASSNAEFIAVLSGRYLEDPDAVDESWRRFFAEFGDDAAALKAERAWPPWARPLPPLNGDTAPAAAPRTASAAAVQEAATASIRALQLIRAYRVRGHL